MSEQPRKPLADDDPQAGQPINELKELELDTSPLFARGVRRKIHRRTTASQLISFSWQTPGMVFAALGNMMVHILNALTARKGD